MLSMLEWLCAQLMEAALIQVIQEAFVQGTSTRKMEKPQSGD